MFILRDQHTNEQLPVTDRSLIEAQMDLRTVNHPYSEAAKGHNSPSSPAPVAAVGDLVYLVNDKNKLHARERYIISSIDGDWFFIKKFSGSKLGCSSYKVKRSECVVVSSHTFTSANSQYDRDNDLEDPPVDKDEIVVPSPPSTLTTPLFHEPISHLPGPDAVSDLGCSNPSDSSVSGTPGDSEPPRRSVRSRRPPTWLASEDWDTSA
jgi:hypothetical protein